MSRLRILCAAALAVAIVALPAARLSAQAQTFPDRTIKIIVGPSPDIFSRIIAEHLQQTWGRPVIVEPRPGGGGKLAANEVLAAPADGYTLLFATPTYTLNTAMKVANYDLLKQFAPVALEGLISYALVVNPALPVKSLPELIAYAKQNPTRVNCASAGVGTVPHIACEYLNKLAGTSIVHTPFHDVNSGMMATVSGTTQMFFGVAVSAKPQIESGGLRALAVSTPQRSILLPEVPTMIEAGYPTFEMPGWGGFLAPAGTPPDVIAKLNAEIRRAVQLPELKAKLVAAGLEPPPLYDPKEFGSFIAADIVRWSRFVDTIGIDVLTREAH